MTVDELIAALLEMTELDPTIGGHPVMVRDRVVNHLKRGEQRRDRGMVQPVVRVMS